MRSTSQETKWNVQSLINKLYGVERDGLAWDRLLSISKNETLLNLTRWWNKLVKMLRLLCEEMFHRIYTLLQSFYTNMTSEPFFRNGQYGLSDFEWNIRFNCIIQIIINNYKLNFKLIVSSILIYSWFFGLIFAFSDKIIDLAYKRKRTWFGSVGNISRALNKRHGRVGKDASLIGSDSNHWSAAKCTTQYPSHSLGMRRTSRGHVY